MVKLTKVQTLFLLIVTLLLSSCGGGMNFPDAKDQPVNADERVKKNIGEGRGLKFTTSLGGKGSGDFMFASSNPLWRATLEKS